MPKIEATVHGDVDDQLGERGAVRPMQGVGTNGLVERDSVLPEKYRGSNEPAMRVAAFEAKASHAEVTSRGNSRGGPAWASGRGRVDGSKDGGEHAGNHLGQWHEEVANGSRIMSEVGMGAEVKGVMAQGPPEKRYDKDVGSSTLDTVRGVLELTLV